MGGMATCGEGIGEEPGDGVDAARKRGLYRGLSGPRRADAARETRCVKPTSAVRTVATTLAAMTALTLSPILYAARTAANPTAPGPALQAALWVQCTLAGEVAMSAGVAAVAAVGCAVLVGRLDRRVEVAVALACFALFAAAGLLGGGRG